MSVKINEQMTSGVTAIFQKKLQDPVVMDAGGSYVKY